MVVFMHMETGDPNINPQNTIVLILGTFTMVSLILGKP